MGSEQSRSAVPSAGYGSLAWGCTSWGSSPTRVLVAVDKGRLGDSVLVGRPGDSVRRRAGLVPRAWTPGLRVDLPRFGPRHRLLVLVRLPQPASEKKFMMTIEIEDRRDDDQEPEDQHRCPAGRWRRPASATAATPGTMRTIPHSRLMARLSPSWPCRTCRAWGDAARQRGAHDQKHVEENRLQECADGQPEGVGHAAFGRRRAAGCRRAAGWRPFLEIDPSRRPRRSTARP